MTAEDIRNLTDQELIKKEADFRLDLFNLRVKIATHQDTNVSKVNILRKDLARLLTIKKERELGIRR